MLTYGSCFSENLNLKPPLYLASRPSKATAFSVGMSLAHMRQLYTSRLSTLSRPAILDYGSPEAHFSLSSFIATRAILSLLSCTLN